MAASTHAGEQAGALETVLDSIAQLEALDAPRETAPAAEVDPASLAPLLNRLAALLAEDDLDAMEMEF